MKRAALAFNNTELAECVKRNVEQYSDEWRVELYSQAPNRTGRLEKLSRANALKDAWCDLIVTDELIGNGVMGTVVGLGKGVPVVGYMRGYGDYTNKHLLHGPLQKRKIYLKTRFCFAKMSDVAAISEAVKAGVSNSYPSFQCPVVERPYDVEYYDSGESNLFDQPTVLTVTNLRYEEKARGVGTIIESFVELDTDWQLVIAGSGNWEEYVRRKAEPHDDVVYLGWRDDIPDLLASADLFAYLSHLDGRPSTVYEARSAGLPCIVGDSSGVPESANQQPVVPPTKAGMKAGLQELIANPERRDRLASEAKQSMTEHNKRVTQDWLELWEPQL